jgi:glycosyltransferase involved in cell wall biosynthesis
MSPSADTGLASIIIPTFNREALLGETLASAFEQTYRPIEILVIDDGSTDNTRALVRQWQDKADCGVGVTLRYIRQRNSGVGSARNHGLIESRGQFIQFLDSDDVLHPRKLELQIACLQQFPEAGYAISGMTMLDDANKWAEISSDRARLTDSAEFYCDCKVLTMVGVYRRQTCYDAGPWCEDISLGEDEEYTFRALLATPKVVYLPGNLCAYREHAGARLTDARHHDKILERTLSIYLRMAKFAAANGHMENVRLVAALAKRLTGFIFEAMELGHPALAQTAIDACRELPVKLGRRVRLAVCEILNTLPTGAFPKIYWAWIKFRKRLADVPRRAA